MNPYISDPCQNHKTCGNLTSHRSGVCQTCRKGEKGTCACGREYSKENGATKCSKCSRGRRREIRQAERGMYFGAGDVY